uniref:SUN domain-containing protein n=1 Tax=Rhizophora mucronata TaxID=61149 RepID=A0A2P2ISA5_RHIMU
MSASTVSITANTAARRRHVVAGEKKSNNVELVATVDQANGAGGNLAVASGGGVDKITASQSKDLSHHSIRGEAVLDSRTSKDLVQVKKTALPNSTASPRRTRRTVPKPEKPRWLTVVSIFTKNFALLLVLIGLAQMVRRLVLKSGDSPVAGTEIGLSEFEGRIAEVESFVKTTSKWIQVQVEAVDKKIDKEVGGLRSKMSKQIDDRASFLETGLKELQARSEVLQKSIGEIKAVDWLSKEEFEKFYEELKKGKVGDHGATDVSFDDIKAYARELVAKEIEKHASDGLARVDYALASGGAMVLKHSEPFVPKENNWFSINSLGGRSARGRIHPDALNMLKPSFGEPGQCFPLKGSSGFVQIRLRTAIIPEAITLEHVAKVMLLL